MKTVLFVSVLVAFTSIAWPHQSLAQEHQHQSTGAFPFVMPNEKPDRPLSRAVARNYDGYESIRPEQNELYSQFKYTKLAGFDYHGGDGTVTRRDPSKVIFAKGKYYVWYTHRNTGFNYQISTTRLPRTDLLGKNKVWPLLDHLNRSPVGGR